MAIAPTLGPRYAAHARGHCEFDEVAATATRRSATVWQGPAKLAMTTSSSHMTRGERPQQYNVLLRSFMSQA